ncbi:uncharacterized protein LOC131933253 isoform X2 [Physella acuta]|uniref:uncharacterized protein LOC131933253 isoform X2 n=2 Tax=Physella acuta TaxID=109671 RepID=UPI0027DCE628|nr:uncharacterized protein LOC131933253 isoform X2 [Physella acuta]
MPECTRFLTVYLLVEKDIKTMAASTRADFKKLTSEKTELMQSCTKCHESDRGYIPVSEFSIQDLDTLNVDDMKQELFDVINSLQNLVVLIKRKFTNPDRWVGDFKILSEPEAAAQEIQESAKARYGSGRIKWVEIKKEEDNQKCPCPGCVKSGKHKKEFSLIVIVTAAHVVNDDNEAKSVECIINYNKDGVEKGLIWLNGHTMKAINRTDDRCEFYVVTHDRKLRNLLISNIIKYHERNKLVVEKLKNRFIQPASENENAANIAVVISHPHYSAKKISIGKVEIIQEKAGPKENTINTQYLYDALTCEGSSGGPVYILGRENVWTNHPHSRWIGVNERILNISAFEWEEETENLQTLREIIAKSPKGPPAKRARK